MKKMSKNCVYDGVLHHGQITVKIPECCPIRKTHYIKEEMKRCPVKSHICDWTLRQLQLFAIAGQCSHWQLMQSGGGDLRRCYFDSSQALFMQLFCCFYSLCLEELTGISSIRWSRVRCAMDLWVCAGPVRPPAWWNICRFSFECQTQKSSDGSTNRTCF